MYTLCIACVLSICYALLTLCSMCCTVLHSCLYVELGIVCTVQYVLYCTSFLSIMLSIACAVVGVALGGFLLCFSTCVLFLVYVVCAWLGCVLHYLIYLLCAAHVLCSILSYMLIVACAGCIQ